MSQYRLMRHVVAVAALGAFASVGCFVVDDEPSDDDGSAGEAGDDSGGTSGSGNGGSSNGGSSTGGKGGTSSTGGSGPGGMAVMKFCNDLAKVDDTGMQVDAELTLSFSGVEATALTGTCTPVVPNPCIPIPAGIAPEVVLTDTETGEEVISGVIDTLTVAAGDEILAIATETADMTGLTVEAGQFLEQYVCAETDPYATMLETRSAPISLRTRHSFRDQNSAATERWMRKAAPPSGLGQ